MYSKISFGSSAGGAAQYNEEGLSKAQKAQKSGKTELLKINNLLSTDHKGIAAEMTYNAALSRSKKPVWNISMSAPEGIRLSDEQWKTAAELNLKALGAVPERFQYAIWRHSDTKNDHIHILLNAVPIDEGAALKRYHTGIKLKQAAPIIEQALQFNAPTQGKGLGIRETIAEVLNSTFRENKPTTIGELVADLEKKGIVSNVKSNDNGPYGINFKIGENKPVKGSAIELEGGGTAKWSNLDSLLSANRAYEGLKQEQAAALATAPPIVPTTSKEGPKIAVQSPTPTVVAKPTVTPTTPTIEPVRQQPQPPTLSERFKKTYGIEATSKQIEALEAGKRLNFSQIGRVVSLQDGKLRSELIVKSIPETALKTLPTTPPTGQKAAAGAAVDKLPAAPTPAPTGQKA
ncbi:relaxase/mobilization nuclease domain-containing protein, partial [Microcoleus sp. herbarium14]